MTESEVRLMQKLAWKVEKDFKPQNVAASGNQKGQGNAFSPRASTMSSALLTLILAQ